MANQIGVFTQRINTKQLLRAQVQEMCEERVKKINKYANTAIAVGVALLIIGLFLPFGFKGDIWTSQSAIATRVVFGVVGLGFILTGWKSRTNLEKHQEKLNNELILAVQYRNDNEVNRLLREGANINAFNKEGETALSVALRDGANVESVLAAGAVTGTFQMDSIIKDYKTLKLLLNYLPQENDIRKNFVEAAFEHTLRHIVSRSSGNFALTAAVVKNHIFIFNELLPLIEKDEFTVVLGIEFVEPNETQKGFIAVLKEEFPSSRKVTSEGGIITFHLKFSQAERQAYIEKMQKMGNALMG